MKKLFPLLIISLVFVFAFLFISSCKNNTQITNPNQQSLGSIDQQLDELEKNVAELSLSISDSSVGVVIKDDRDPKANCCNTNYPHYTFHACTSYEECDWSVEDPCYPYLDCALRWAAYNHIPNQDLGFLGCEKPTPTNAPNLSQLTKSQQDNNPYFTWNFIYCHYYNIQRKIGGGQWSTLKMQKNCYDGEYGADPDCGASSSHLYKDTGINLSTIQNNVYYRVKAIVYNKQSLNPPQIVYYPPPSVNIIGPYQLTTTQTGTFTAVVSGGETPFSYSWQKYQDCEDKSNSEDSKYDDGTKSVPCGSWEPISGNSATVYISGFIPSFRLKVTVNAQNGSDVDYHFVDVILP